MSISCVYPTAMHIVPGVRDVTARYVGNKYIYVWIRLRLWTWLACGLLHWLAHLRRDRLGEAAPGYTIVLHVSCLGDYVDD